LISAHQNNLKTSKNIKLKKIKKIQILFKNYILTISLKYQFFFLRNHNFHSQTFNEECYFSKRDLEVLIYHLFLDVLILYI